MKTSGREMRKMTAGEKGKEGKEESDAEKVSSTPFPYTRSVLASITAASALVHL